jgi:hypothetical protein
MEFIKIREGKYKGSMKGPGGIWRLREHASLLQGL